jgi:hypothetical protein
VRYCQRNAPAEACARIRQLPPGKKLPMLSHVDPAETELKNQSWLPITIAIGEGERDAS